MKAKGKGKAPLSCPQLPMPIVFLLCVTCFFAGFYGSTSIDPQEAFSQAQVSEARGRKSLQAMQDGNLDLSEHGESGDNYISDMPFQILSWHPRALLFKNFTTKEQCQKIISAAKSRLAPSTLALRTGETEENTKDTRTSSGTFLTAKQDKSGTLRWVEEKMARATMIPVSNGEAFNILRYEIGQKYNSHYDYFNPAEYGPQKSQRMASFLLYLSDVEEGGETMFPFEGYQNMNINYDYKRCVGLKVKPRQGDALLFYSILPNGTFDKTSLHGSCPVVKGEKWVATKWIRDQDHW